MLTLDEVRTAFHEFGHALHGMFSNVKYPRFSGTSVPRDFVEYPSQVNEMWAKCPEVLKNYARRYQTGALLPPALLEKVEAAEKFNQGFTTTEYLAAALLDQSWHQLKAAEVPESASVAWNQERPQLFHWRTHNQQEVDLVLEGDFGLIAVEIKHAQAVREGHSETVVLTLRASTAAPPAAPGIAGCTAPWLRRSSHR